MSETRGPRIGVIVPSSNVTMETELAALLRRHLASDGAATLHASRARMRQVTPDELQAMNREMERCARELADARCDVVVTACLVALMAQGPGFHREVERRIAAVLREEGDDAPVISSAGALIAALDALGARRVGIVAPYAPALTATVGNYIETCGIEVGDALSLDVPDNLAVAALHPADLREHWRRVDLGGCDALVLSACVQMPSLAAIAAVERDCGLPVVLAATATAFCALRTLGLETRIADAGHLLTGAVDERVTVTL